MYAGVPYAPVAPAYSLLAQRLSPRSRAIVAVAARPAWCSRPTARRSRVRSSRSPADGAEIVTCVPSATQRGARRRSTNCWSRRRPARWTTRMRGSDRTPSPRCSSRRARPGAQGRDQHAADALREPGDDPHACCRFSPTSRRCSATGCRGTTPSAATTTSASSLYNGGTLYIDDGKPMPAGVRDDACANLREIATTAYFNVPRGYEMLRAARCAQTPALRAHFFSRAARCCSAPRRRSAAGRGRAPGDWPSRRAASRIPLRDRPRRDRERAVRAVHRRRRLQRRAGSACRRPASS